MYSKGSMMLPVLCLGEIVRLDTMSSEQKGSVSNRLSSLFGYKLPAEGWLSDAQLGKRSCHDLKPVMAQKLDLIEMYYFFSLFGRYCNPPWSANHKEIRQSYLPTFTTTPRA